MPIAATHKFSAADAENFLKSGALLGFGTDQVLVGVQLLSRNSEPQGDDIEFFAPDFFLEDPAPWWRFQNIFLTTRQELKKSLQTFREKPEIHFQWDNSKKEKFADIFADIQSEMTQGKIEKAVPVVFAESRGEITFARKAALICELLKNSVKPTPYGIWDENGGMLGGSPEILFSFDLKSQTLHTMALAGTRKSSEESLQSLVTDAKEMFEHGLVVKDIREKLAGIGELQISPTFVWDLGPLCHLRTDIELELEKPMSPMAVVRELTPMLHPTAALGVSPRGANWRQIRNWQTLSERFRFGAPFGVLSRNGLSQIVVAIRNLQWNEQKVILGTGCGVVRESIFENEWKELALKRQATLKLFGME